MWFESVIFHSCHQICGFSNTVSVGTGLIIYIIHAVFIVFRVWTSCFYRFNLYIFHAYKGVLKKDQPKRVVFSYLIESVRTPAYEDDREIHETTVLQRQVYFGSFWVWEKSCFKKSNFSCIVKKKNAGLFLITKNKSFEFGKTRCILDAVVCLIFLYFLNFFPFSSLSFSFPRILSLHTCKNSTSCSLFCVSIFLSQSHTPLFPKERVCVSLCCEANKGYLLSCKSVCVGWSREWGMTSGSGTWWVQRMCRWSRS